MDKVRNIVFQISGIMQSGVAKTFNEVSKLTKSTKSALDNMVKQNPFDKISASDYTRQLEIVKVKNEALGNSFSRSQSRVAKLRNEYEHAQQKCKQLALEINNCGVPTRKQISDFDKAIQKSDKLKQSWRDAAVESRNLRKELTLQNNELENLNRTKAYQVMRNKLQDRMQQHKQNTSTHMANAANSMYMAQNAMRSVSFLVEPINQAMKFESVMADIRKLIHFDTPQEFAEMGEQLKQLSTRVPMAVDGLGHIAAAAAQAGIAKNEILQFTENAAQMGVAYNITAEQAGDMMAKWRSAFGLTQEKVVQLADQVNILSDNSAASGVEIGSVVSRIGSLGKIAGVTEAEIAALAATSIGAGVAPEVAATGIKKMLTSLTSSSAMAKTQVTMLGKMGVNVTQLAKDIKSQGVPAILSLLAKLKQLPEYEQTSALKQVFGEESIAPIAGIMANLDQVGNNLSLVGEKSKYAGSMIREFNARSATTENTMQLFKNNLSAVAITIGNTFLPAINQTMHEVNDLLNNSILPYVKAHSESIMVLGKVAIAMAGVIAGVAIAKAVFSSLAMVWSVGNGALALLGRTLLWFIPQQLRVAAATKLMSYWQSIANVLAAVNPYVKLALLLVAVGSAICWVYTHWETFTGWINTVWEKIKALFGWLIKVKDAIGSLFDGADGKKTLEIDTEIKNGKKFTQQIEAQVTARQQKERPNMTMTSNPTVIIQGNADAEDIYKGMSKADQHQQTQISNLFNQQTRMAN